MFVRRVRIVCGLALLGRPWPQLAARRAGQLFPCTLTNSGLLSSPFKYATPFPRGLSRVDVAERLRRQTANEPLRSAPLRTWRDTPRNNTRGTCHESKANTGGLSAGDGFSRAGRQETCTDVRGEGAPTFCKRQDPRGRYHAPAEEGPRRRGVTPRARQTLRRRVFVRQATLLLVMPAAT